MAATDTTTARLDRAWLDVPHSAKAAAARWDPAAKLSHIGGANATGQADDTFAHLREVTGMTAAETARHVDAGRLWTERSERNWCLDLRMLTDVGATPALARRTGRACSHCRANARRPPRRAGREYRPTIGAGA